MGMLFFTLFVASYASKTKYANFPYYRETGFTAACSEGCKTFSDGDKKCMKEKDYGLEVVNNEHKRCHPIVYYERLKPVMPCEGGLTLHYQSCVSTSTDCIPTFDTKYMKCYLRLKRFEYIPVECSIKREQQQLVIESPSTDERKKSTEFPENKQATTVNPTAKLYDSGKTAIFVFQDLQDNSMESVKNATPALRIDVNLRSFDAIPLRTLDKNGHEGTNCKDSCSSALVKTDKNKKEFVKIFIAMNDVSE